MALGIGIDASDRSKENDDLLNQELKFTRNYCMDASKCYQAWAHRGLLLAEILKRTPKLDKLVILQGELKHIEKCMRTFVRAAEGNQIPLDVDDKGDCEGEATNDIDTKNMNAWMYRGALLHIILELVDQSVALDILQKELSFTEYLVCFLAFRSPIHLDYHGSVQ